MGQNINGNDPAYRLVDNLLSGKPARRRGDCKEQSGTMHELCYAVHAEQNAIIQAARVGCSVEGCTLYCTHQPCVICAKIIINSGISRIVYKEGYPDDFSMQLFKEAGVTIEKYDEL